MRVDASVNHLNIHIIQSFNQRFERLFYQVILSSSSHHLVFKTLFNQKISNFFPIRILLFWFISTYPSSAYWEFFWLAWTNSRWKEGAKKNLAKSHYCLPIICIHKWKLPYFRLCILFKYMNTVLWLIIVCPLIFSDLIFNWSLSKMNAISSRR